MRAYEVKTYTKKSIYEWFNNTKSNYQHEDFYKIYIDFPKNELLNRIHSRAREMIKKGAVMEVKKFNSLKVRNDKTASKAIGIREVNEYLLKKIEIDQVIEKISIKTRQYAKRQRTWASGNMQNWNKIIPIELNKFLKKI
jgi:tRNA delta(2)-isopentenylpyrophosphate transferase